MQSGTFRGALFCKATANSAAECHRDQPQLKVVCCSYLQGITHAVIAHKPGINLFEHSSEYSFFARPNQEPSASNNEQKNPFKCWLIYKSSYTTLTNKGVLSSKITLFV